MRLNHVNLPVNDVVAARDFFAKYFGMTTIFERGEQSLTIMRDDHWLVLALSRLGTDSEIGYPRDFHIGFFVESRGEVDRIHEQLVADGLHADPPRPQAGGWGFFIDAPGGIVVEVASSAE